MNIFDSPGAAHPSYVMGLVSLTGGVYSISKLRHNKLSIPLLMVSFVFDYGGVQITEGRSFDGHSASAGASAIFSAVGYKFGPDIGVPKLPILVLGSTSLFYNMYKAYKNIDSD